MLAVVVAAACTAAAHAHAPPTDGREAMVRSERLGSLAVHSLASLCPECWDYNTHEPRHLWEPLFRAERIRPSRGLFVDVGAACDLVDGGVALKNNFSVLAFETRPQCVATLKERFAAELKSAALKLRWNAVANVSGAKISLFMSGDSSSTKLAAVDQLGSIERRGFRGKDGKGAGQKVVVPTVTLDEAVGQQPVAILKLDIQGAELDALMGAHALLSRPPSSAALVQFEYYAHLRPDLAGYEVLHLLRGYGYICFFIGNVGNAKDPLAHLAREYGPILHGARIVRPSLDVPLPPSGGLANKITTDFVCVKRSAAQYAELAAEQAKRARALTESLESIQALQKIQRGSAGVKA